MAHGGSIEGQLLSVFLYVGSEWVLYLLLGLSVVSLAVALERFIHFLRHREDIDALSRDVEASLRDGAPDKARARLHASRSHVAQVMLRALDAMDQGAAAVEEVIAGQSQIQKLKMERGLAFLGTLGNNAPFLGLFGTVLGIIRAFRDLAANTGEGAQAVMAGIAEALVATAVGLLVALPAVAIFNVFQRRIKAQLAASDAAARVLLAHLKGHREEQ